MKESLNGFIGKKIVIDTKSSWSYIGNLEEVLSDSVVMTDVDVHDNNDTTATKEIYLVNSRKTGIISNRDKVYINMEYIVSFSPFDSVKKF